MTTNTINPTAKATLPARKIIIIRGEKGGVGSI
jgi:hypothetical protein